MFGVKNFGGAVVNCYESEGVVTIKIDGVFDFTCNKAFSEAFGRFAKQSNFRVDLTEVVSLDSSALGMLLLLRDHVNRHEGSVRLIRPIDTVNDTLKMANFDRLFEIER